LDALIERHGLICDARHRALGDARVVHELLSVWEREVAQGVLAPAVADLLQEAVLPAHLSCDLSDDLPELPGVYRFFGEADVLLYVGKSRNLRKRVLEHFAATHRSDAEQRLAVLVRRVTWQEMAGDVGALLVESRTVKAERPLYNRQLKQVEQLYTIRVEGVASEPIKVAVVAVDSLDDVSVGEHYGLYRDERSALRALEAMARAHQLCAKDLGIEAGAAGGACFAFQLKRCKGVCVGEESPLMHGIRVRMALSSIKLPPWPYLGRILLVETDWRGQEDFHVLDRWRYLGTVQDPTDAVGLDGKTVPFAADVYRLLKRSLSTLKGVRLMEGDRA
jgi:DNA polymerase-3 subunit epsilon